MPKKEKKDTAFLANRLVVKGPPSTFVPAIKEGVFLLQINDSVAQLVEQYTFNVWVLGSNPSGITKSLSEMGGFFFFTTSVFWFSEGLMY